MERYTLREIVADAKAAYDVALEENFCAMEGKTPIFAVAQRRMKRIQKMDSAEFRSLFGVGKTKKSILEALSKYGYVDAGCNNERVFCAIFDMVGRIGRRKKRNLDAWGEDDNYYPKNLQDCYEELLAAYSYRGVLDEDSEYIVVCL